MRAADDTLSRPQFRGAINRAKISRKRCTMYGSAAYGSKDLFATSTEVYCMGVVTGYRPALRLRATLVTGQYIWEAGRGCVFATRERARNYALSIRSQVLNARNWS